MSDSDDDMPELIEESSSDDEDHAQPPPKSVTTNSFKTNERNGKETPKVNPQANTGFSRGFLSSKPTPPPMKVAKIPIYVGSEDEEQMKSNDDDYADLPELMVDDSSSEDEDRVQQGSSGNTKKVKKKKRNKKPKRKSDSVALTEEIRRKKEMEEEQERTRLESLHIQKQKDGAIKIQSFTRMAYCRKQFRNVIMERLKDRKDVTDVWGDVFKALNHPLPKQFSWLDEKDRCDMVVSDSALEALLGIEAVEERKQIEKLQAMRDVKLDDIDDTDTASNTSSNKVDSDSKCDVAVASASILAIQGPVDEDTDEETYAENDTEDRGEIPSFELIELSDYVHKWLGHTDKLHVEQFWRCMSRLAAGGRTYSLMKRLKGCTYPINESKLNKGDRILWTEVLRVGGTGNTADNRTILVWYVSKHQRVSHYLSVMEDYFSRQKQALVSCDIESGGTTLRLGEDTCLLNPTKNSPMKIFQVRRHEFGSVASRGVRGLQMRLSKHEQEVNDIPNSVLLIGRSGTGKTVVLANRMVHDWQLNLGKGAGEGSCFHQLFVCRSKSLLEEVRKAYTMRHEDTGSCQEGTVAHFRTLSRFIDVMDLKISERYVASAREYVSAKRITYAIFRDEFFTPYLTSLPAKKRIPIDACIIWTQIQSHIKGSCEAVYDALHAGRVGGVDRIGITLEKYLTFAADRCRLSPEKREIVYDVYRHYTFYLEQQQAWDDCDRTTDMLLRSRLDGTIDYSNQHGMPYHKVYVDEVQDSTQAEILLFFLAVGNNSRALFMAGDPAQSIVEGVDFRFEEIRAILHANRAVDRDKREAIAKVQTMKRNFRSHAGILNCAAGVLGLLFTAFPAAAKVLQKDEGLCRGPRPGFIRDYAHTNRSFLADILNKNDRYTVLCHDGELDGEGGLLPTCSFLDSISIDKMPDIYTIRDSKGMEYDKVIIVNFFCRLPISDQKHWKRRLRDTSELPEENCPQMESQLKLLYTAITRCCQNLVLIETRESLAGVAFFNWLKDLELAEEIVEVPDDDEGFRTNDEWKVEGIKAAMSAQGDNAIERLSRAISCFEKARLGADPLRVRASLQKEVEQFRYTLHMQLVDGMLPPAIERKAARLLKDSLDKCLTSQAYDLCKLVTPHVPGSEYRKSIFEKEVKMKLTPAFEM